MASMHTIHYRDDSVGYKVHWRHRGKQKTLTFTAPEAAERHRINVERFGHDAAMEILGVTDAGRDSESLSDTITAHIDALTGVEPGTIKRYRSWVEGDAFSTIADLPTAAITEVTISTWIQWLTSHQVEVPKRGGGTIIKTVTNTGKTIANKHGLLSAALARAVRDGKIDTNPCDHTRLPEKTPVDDPVFMSQEMYSELEAAMPAQWRPLTRWLVATGMRFSEATALTVGDVDSTAGVVRISKAWKWTGTTEERLSYPKSKAGRRTINVPKSILDELDLSRPKKSLLFTNRDGARVTYSRYYDGGWKRAMGTLTWHASPHDLRHTCASWMIAKGTHMLVVSRHLGHESIKITADVYSHLDRSSFAQAAAAIDDMFV
ncbi:site-specific integrase [Gordonia sp. ABSL1-1]|uniref:tyrosine-type recombinase/integrase n=1 Tax=Gordonia sp. ABSL1-1 TaxID=3053923 RepID=UPI002574353B|nr:site-specific integrase [Gordonia sp. ABSL1-1]MDL9938730.1 site-specific integrase [Gordonia sp. ABSL1-1]